MTLTSLFVPVFLGALTDFGGAYARTPGCMTSSCHSDLKIGASVHGPVKANGCWICHDPGVTPENAKVPADHPEVASHKGRNVNETCLSCHDSFKRLFQHGKGSVHAPLASKGCVECHNPHHSKFPKLLKTSPGGQSCLSCHDKLKQGLANSTHKHAAIYEKGGCLSCHDPHGSTASKALLKKTVSDTCLSCHDKPVRGDDGRMIGDMKNWKSASFKPHGEKSKSPPDCASCHAVHGNSEHALLKGSYTKEFYAPYSASNAGLCFSCHKSELATAVASADATKFRQGAKNLHFVHVTGTKRARTCQACHDPHQTEGESLIKNWTQYGAALLPIEFKKTPTGGTCATACHGKKQYDREAK